jgi:hypothetical protein
MVQTAAHLVDNVMPWRAFRQIVLTVPKRIRFFLKDRRTMSAVIRIFMRALESEIRKACPDAPRRSRIGAAVFVQRSGSALNLHIHLHVVATVGVFAALVTPSAQPETHADSAHSAGPAGSAKPTHSAGSATGLPAVRFHEATDLTDANIQAFTDSLTKKVRKRVLRWMFKNNLLEPDVAADMLTWQGYGGFSIDASVHIPAHDRYGLERLLRYCARPPFAAERISLMGHEQSQPHGHRRLDEHQLEEHRPDHHRPEDLEKPNVIYQLPPGDMYDRTELVLTPFQFIQRLTRLIPPPRVHRNRYFGAFAAASPLRPHVVKFASAEPQLAERLKRAASQMKLFDDDATGTDPEEKQDTDSPAPDSPTPDSPAAPMPEHRRRRRASVLWAMLIARIYEILPLVCPRCSSAMKLIAFITDGPTIERILAHLQLPTEPPPLAPARDPPQVEMMFGDGGQHQHRPNDNHRHYDPYDQTHWP